MVKLGYSDMRKAIAELTGISTQEKDEPFLELYSECKSISCIKVSYQVYGSSDVCGQSARRKREVGQVTSCQDELCDSNLQSVWKGEKKRVTRMVEPEELTEEEIARYRVVLLTGSPLNFLSTKSFYNC